MSSPHILIIGGGIGGLALAQNLKNRGVSFTLFERDASPTARAQGYRVRVSGSGVEGLRACLNDELFDLFEKTCAETHRLGAGAMLNAVDGTPGQALFPGGKPGQGPPWSKPNRPTPGPHMSYAVDRTTLRNVLLLGQENNIKFGKSLTHYEISSTGVTAFFSDGTSEQGSLLVGADGTASPVRRQFLPDVRYVNTGSRVIYGKSPLTNELVTRLPESIMKGMCVIQDSSPLTLFLETIRFPKDAAAESQGRVARVDNYVYWVLGGSAETVGLSETEFHSLSAQAAANLTLKLTAHWDPSFKAIFELQNNAQSSPLRLITAKRERPEWTPSAKVVLMGDAIQ